MPHRNRAVGVGNRIAMWIVGGPAEHLVDPLDQALRDDVLELFGLVVDLVPPHAHHLDEERLDQPMPPQHEPRELLARAGEPDTAVRLVLPW
jgi:CelD/BcsL family acetyltransferase involved in cellulose biosynthesis